MSALYVLNFKKQICLFFFILINEKNFFFIFIFNKKQFIVFFHFFAILIFDNLRYNTFWSRHFISSWKNGIKNVFIFQHVS